MSRSLPGARAMCSSRRPGVSSAISPPSDRFCSLRPTSRSRRIAATYERPKTSAESMEQQPFKLGVFMPVANNGWIISKTAPQYVPTFELNKKIAQHAEEVGFDYVFSMAKWTGYGGATEYWDHSIESLILMTALAPVTRRLRLVASVAPVLIHPTIVAKMAVTMDDVSGGRLGLNLVSSDHEYIRMGMYPDN